MSILVEIADRAGSTVEDVVRVLTREPVPAAARERVLAVLDELGGEEARILERFALAALHDAVPPGAEQPEQSNEPDPGAPSDESGEAAARVADEGALQSVTAADVPQKDALTAQVGLLLEELVEAVKEIRREGLADRQERIDDLAVLVELLTTGWRRVDRRLGRVERLVERLEADRPLGGASFAAEPGRVTPIRTETASLEQATLETAPLESAPLESAPLEHGRSLAPPVDAPAEPKRPWLPLTAILVLVVAGGLAVLAFDLLPSSSDQPRLLAGPKTTSAPVIAPTTASPSPAAPSLSTPGLSTPGVAATTVSTPTTSGPRTRTAVPTPTTPRATTKGFQPARDFVWTPADNADYYAVRFLRNGALFYRARPTRPRLSLPKMLVFRPGSYRWVVRPGFGAPAENRVGAPMVDSKFSVAR